MTRIVLALTFITLCASAAPACSCYDDPHAKTFRRTETILVGRLISVGKDDIYDPALSDAPFRLLTFRVEKRWKGAGGEVFTAITHMRPGPCSAFEFREGERYLVYAGKHHFVTSDCASSAELGSERARARMKDLNSFRFRLKARLWRL